MQAVTTKCLSLCMYTVFIRILQLAIFLQLTGELPFQPTEEDEIVAPDRVPHRHRPQWRQYEAMQRLYTHYVSTVCFSCHQLCGIVASCRNLLVFYEGVDALQPAHFALTVLWLWLNGVTDHSILVPLCCTNPA